MKWRRLSIIAMALLMLSFILCDTPFHSEDWNPLSETDSFNQPKNEIQFQGNPLNNNFVTSSEPSEGVLHPATIENVGYTTSGHLSVRTDTYPNPTLDLPIDQDHNWVASSAEVDVWNLTQLYAINGTFDEGVPGININPNGTLGDYPHGWSAASVSTDPDQQQIAAYDDTGRSYVTVQNEAEVTNNPQHIYTHFAGTQVLWNQSMAIVPYTDQFVLSFDYLYLQGPLGTGYSGNCSIHVFINGTSLWQVNLPTLNQRGVWYSTGQVPINIALLRNSTTFMIGLVIDETMVVDGDDDYDGDSFPDGAINTQFISVYLDDVSLVGANNPTPEQVDLEFTAGSGTTPIAGSSGSGAATIVNGSYWVSNPVSTQITSNSTVSFDYETRLKSHRFTNSTWTTDIANEGVHYTVTPDASPQVSFFTYVGFSSDYENLTIRVLHPGDWQNATIFDPFLSDVTGLCSIQEGSLEIPTFLMDRLGMWRFTLDAPNYASSITIEKLDVLGLSWGPASVYRSWNRTRAAITISTATDAPDPLNLVNVTWTTPNGTEWISETLNGGVGGNINGSGFTLGPLNASAGLWSVHVHWTNGTEIACGTTTFEVHHAATLEPIEALIEAESGDVVWSLVTYRDAENGDYLMDPTSSVSANWSMSTVNYVPNPAQKWWEASLDTSVLASVDSIVVVNASLPYYDDASCTYVVRLMFTQNELVLSQTAGQVGLGEPFTAEFNFADRYGTPIENATVSADYTGPAGGLKFGNATDLGSGDYSLTITPSTSGTYSIVITASTDYHVAEKATLFLFVGSLASNLESFNGTGAIIEFGASFRLVVRYTNWSGDGLTGADVSIFTMTPDLGLNATPAEDHGDGNYSVVLEPWATGTFTVVLKVNITNYDPQYPSFSLHVTDIGTDMDTISLVEALYYGRSYSFTFGYRTSTNGTGIADASPTATGVGSEWIDFVELGDGLYNISVVPEDIGSYTVYIAMTKDGYQTGTSLFTFQTARVPVRVEMTQPVWVQYLQLDLSLRVVEADTGDPVSNATVRYVILRGGSPGETIDANETTPGVYVAKVAWNDFADNSRIAVEITVEHEFYELAQVFERQVSVVPNEAALFGHILDTYGLYLFASGAMLAMAAVGLRVRARKKRERQQLALGIKRRYDDANNLLGIVILHRTSGLPVYSNILKGGFEEGMISAFITAITHFRAEIFATGEDDITYEVIPISDIIRAVPTKNLVCAFITVSSASPQQEERMVDFAKGVGSMLDFEMSQRPTQSSDAVLAQVLEALFDERLDGFLLQYYKRGVGAAFPRKYRPVEDALAITEAADCARPMYMAKNIAHAQGVSEAEASLLVLEAIEQQLLLACDQREILSFTRMNWEIPRGA